MYSTRTTNASPRDMSTNSLQPPPKRLCRRVMKWLEKEEYGISDDGDCDEDHDMIDSGKEDDDSDDETLTDEELYDVSGEWDDDTETVTDLEDSLEKEWDSNWRPCHIPAPGERIPKHTGNPHPISPAYALALSNNHCNSEFQTFRNSLELVRIKDMKHGYQKQNCSMTDDIVRGGKTLPYRFSRIDASTAFPVTRNSLCRELELLPQTKLVSQRTWSKNYLIAKCFPQKGDLMDEPHIRFPEPPKERKLLVTLDLERTMIINDLHNRKVSEKWNREKYSKRLEHLGSEKWKPVRQHQGMLRPLIEAKLSKQWTWIECAQKGKGHWIISSKCLEWKKENEQSRNVAQEKNSAYRIWRRELKWPKDYKCGEPSPLRTIAF